MELPSYVKSRSPETQKKWVGIVQSSETPVKGVAVANTWLKSQVIIKPKTVVKSVSLQVNDKEGFIKRTETGEEYIEFVLTDNLPDSEGVQYPDYLLQKWADEINSGKSLVGDIDHQEYDKILAGGYTKDEILDLLGTKRGIATSLKAIYDKGKLWIRALIDKRYKKQIRERAKGVSLEALLTYDDNDNVVDGTLAGFTFAVEDNPANPRAAIV